jgi:hypothetical protein
MNPKLPKELCEGADDLDSLEDHIPGEFHWMLILSADKMREAAREIECLRELWTRVNAMADAEAEEGDRANG